MKVVGQGDGTYKVIDGNATLHVLRELNWKYAIAEVEL